MVSCGNEFHAIADYCENKYLFLFTLSLYLIIIYIPTDSKMMRNAESLVSAWFLHISHDSKAASSIFSQSSPFQVED